MLHNFGDRTGTGAAVIPKFRNVLLLDYQQVKISNMRKFGNKFEFERKICLFRKKSLKMDTDRYNHFYVMF